MCGSEERRRCTALELWDRGSQRATEKCKQTDLQYLRNGMTLEMSTPNTVITVEMPNKCNEGTEVTVRRV